jgi:hypothetical protein
VIAPAEDVSIINYFDNVGIADQYYNGIGVREEANGAAEQAVRLRGRP